MEVLRINNYNSSFYKFKSGSKALYLQKLVALHPLKKEEFDQIYFQVIDQKELSLYNKPLAAFRINIENSQVIIEESFAVIDHLTIQLVATGFVSYDFEVYFELK